MHKNLSFWPILQQSWTDFIQDAKKYFVLFTIKSIIGTMLFVALYCLTTKKLFFDIVTDRSYFLREFFLFVRSYGQAGNILVLLLFFGLYLVFFIFYVGFLHFVYIKKIENRSLSITSFFISLSIKNTACIFGIYFLLTLVIGAISIITSSIFSAIIYLFHSPTITSLLFWFFFISPLLVSITEYSLAHFIVFEKMGFAADKALDESRIRTKKERFKIGLILFESLLFLYITSTLVLSPFLLILTKTHLQTILGSFFSSFQSTVLERPFFLQSNPFYTFLILFFIQIYRLFFVTLFLLCNGEIYKQLSLIKGGVK